MGYPHFETSRPIFFSEEPSWADFACVFRLVVPTHKSSTCVHQVRVCCGSALSYEHTPNSTHCTRFESNIQNRDPLVSDRPRRWPIAAIVGGVFCLLVETTAAAEHACPAGSNAFSCQRFT